MASRCDKKPSLVNNYSHNGSYTQLIEMAQEEKVVAICQTTNKPSGKFKAITPFLLFRFQAEKKAVYTKIVKRCNIKAILIENIYSCTPMQ